MRTKILEKKYGTRTVLGQEIYHIMPSGRKVPMVLCKCECGTERFVQIQHLMSGASKGCGCENNRKAAERLRIQSTKHGMEGSQPYKKFMSAKARCNNPKTDSYYRYGGRGIKMQWKDFKEFRDDMKDSYYEHVSRFGEKNTTLDRIDYNGNYCKENCRWATWQEQYENMSINHNVVYKGKWYPTIAKMCRALGVRYQLVKDRIRYGWGIEEAVEKPLYSLSNKNAKNRRAIQQTSHTLQKPLW